MLKYVRVTNEETGLCEVGIGTNSNFYESIGMREADVQQSDIDGCWYLTEKCPMKTEEEKVQEERERINMLSLTAADVERAIYKARGMDFEDILELVKNNPEIDTKALKIELKANNFYRGNPYIDTIGVMLGYSMEDLDNLFETGSLPEKTIELEPKETTEEITGADEASDISSNQPAEKL